MVWFDLRGLLKSRHWSVKSKTCVVFSLVVTFYFFQKNLRLFSNIRNRKSWVSVKIKNRMETLKCFCRNFQGTKPKLSYAVSVLCLSFWKKVCAYLLFPRGQGYFMAILSHFIGLRGAFIFKQFTFKSNLISVSVSAYLITSESHRFCFCHWLKCRPEIVELLYGHPI